MIQAGEDMTYGEFQKRKSASDENVYREIFEEYCNYVYTIIFNILRSCGTREDIEECVSDTFADVYSCYDSQTEREGDIKGFISVIARRKAIRYYNRLTSHGTDISLDDENVFHEVQASDDVEAKAENSEMQKILIDKLNELGEPDTTIIIQKYFYNRTAVEISEMVSLSQQAIRVRCFRALKQLKKMLSKSGITLQER